MTSSSTILRALTDTQIETLQIEAGQVGDSAQVAICRRALAGSQRARRECARVIADGRAQALDIDGVAIQHDASGIGAAWRPATTTTCPADAQQDIAEEIIDGGITSCHDYVASNGQHYRW